MVNGSWLMVHGEGLYWLMVHGEGFTINGSW